MKKLALGTGLLIVIFAAGYLWLNDKPTKNFPYIIRDGHVYCSEELRNILVDEIKENDLRLDFADANTFRRPTEAEREEARSRGRDVGIGGGAGIDAVDKNQFYYQCSWINFSAGAI